MENNVPAVTDVKIARVGPRRWGTDITFANGAILRFTGRVGASAGEKMYRDMLTAGFTHKEVLALHWRVKPLPPDPIRHDQHALAGDKQERNFCQG